MKILTIGNSFTWSLQRYFPAVVHAAGEELVIKYMNFGGCELERHWGYISAEENDPVIRVYGGERMDAALEKTPWDIVTIQQASHASFHAETFEPWAGNIVNFVRKHAPQAEIVVQQTWAYREDHPWFRPGNEKDLDQAEMYRRLTENYKALASRYSLRMIPTGYAVQLARKTALCSSCGDGYTRWQELRAPDLPASAPDVVGNFSWLKQPDGEMRMNPDLIHLNPRGQYLQACLWFAFLYGKDPELSAKYFLPEEFGARDAAILRSLALQAAKTDFSAIC